MEASAGGPEAANVGIDGSAGPCSSAGCGCRLSVHQIVGGGKGEQHKLAAVSMKYVEFWIPNFTANNCLIAYSVTLLKVFNHKRSYKRSSIPGSHCNFFPFSSENSHIDWRRENIAYHGFQGKMRPVEKILSFFIDESRIC